MKNKIEEFKTRTGKLDAWDFDVERLLKACNGDINAAASLFDEDINNHDEACNDGTMRRQELIEQYTEENYSLEELEQMALEKSKNCREEGICVELLTPEPVKEADGNIVGTTTQFPAQLNIYRAVWL